MMLHRTISLSLLGAALLAQMAAAQTAPTPSKTRKPNPRMAPNTTPAARAADPLRGASSSGQGSNNYAAPGQPINVTDNGKNTPAYDGSAAGTKASTGHAKTALTTPK
ncbi:MAG: hypothetical protein ACRYG7_15905 [Janthinobacterium lividum]